MWRRQRPVLLPVQPLHPETVAVASRPQRLGAFVPAVAPAAVAGPFQHRARGDERTGRTPHHLLGRVVDVRANERKEIVREPVTRGKPPRDEEDAGLACHHGRIARIGELHSLRKVGSGAKELDVAHAQVGEVESRLGVATPP